MTITRGALTRKARLALCASLAAGSSAFAASVQSADASTVPVTLELKTAVISAGQDAHALTPVIVAEKRIIADGCSWFHTPYSWPRPSIGSTRTS